MFYIVRFIVVWSTWLIFADKRRWKEMLPVCIFASFLSAISDIIVDHYPFWDYFSDSIHPLILDLGDEFGIYPVVTYLFTQWLPKQQRFWHMFLYWFIWAGVAIFIEYLHVSTNHMTHNYGWTYWHSYIADWILFWLFYKFHKLLDLKKLSS